MKVSDLQAGGLYYTGTLLYSATREAAQVTCLDPEPRWANRVLPRFGNGILSSLPDEWVADDVIAAKLLAIEPFDSRLHGHKRGWPAFVVAYPTPDGPTRLIPRAIYPSMLTPWDVYIAKCEKATKEAAKKAVEWAAGTADRKRLEEERERAARRRLVERNQQARRAEQAVDVLARLGIVATTFRYDPANISIPVADVRRLLAEIAPEEMALAVLAG